MGNTPGWTNAESVCAGYGSTLVAELVLARAAASSGGGYTAGEYGSGGVVAASGARPPPLLGPGLTSRKPCTGYGMAGAGGTGGGAGGR